MISKSVIFLALVLSISSLSFASPHSWKDAAPYLNKSKSYPSIPSTSRAVDLSVDIDVLGISEAIAGAISSAQNREGFVKNVRNTAFFKADAKYNVMVFNLSQAHRDRFQGVKLYASATYGDIVYGIWVFESGTFYNDGDGGYINWAFRGWFDRDGGEVRFRERGT